MMHGQNHIKSVSITYFECVCSLSFQHAKRMLLIYYHVWPVWPYRIFITPAHKRQDFRIKKTYET